MARIATETPGVGEFVIRRGKGWVYFLFTSKSVGRTWSAVKTALEDQRSGPQLRRATIVTCEGSRGWDDYLLLHHFDAGQALDKLVNPNRK